MGERARVRGKGSRNIYPLILTFSPKGRRDLSIRNLLDRVLYTL